MATATEPSTTEAIPSRTAGPVPVAITGRPAASPVPVAITSRPIADDEVRITPQIGTFSESLGCSCQADDDQPY
ncbi:hypothetical protein [Streptomyces fructofermentans]|uniref:Uncharacterized protein n=1 Tax=Streptomyces fructofermentans TaxID=152141 RepID=A0A918NNZ0_9ACTN|nr:hypothetical protein [Streptomyces fructofermentans]GGX84348.1 hypothetical protein GCM10010515_59910 [Streptomyces fructofermentans]